MEQVIFYTMAALEWAFLLAGLVFILTGALGLMRLPGFYNRLHAAGLTDTLGIELLLLSFMLRAGWSPVTLKLILIGLFILITSPTATHALANAAYTANLRDPAAGKREE